MFLSSIKSDLTSVGVVSGDTPRTLCDCSANNNSNVGLLTLLLLLQNQMDNTFLKDLMKIID